MGLSPFKVNFQGPRNHYYLISRHPIDTKNPINFISDPFDGYSWLMQGIILILSTFGMLFCLGLYNKYCPQKIFTGIDFSYYVMRYLFGWTEPEQINVFQSQISAGRISSLCYMILVTAFLIFYQLDFRTHLIGQKLEKPIKSFDDDIDIYNERVFTFRGI